CGSSAAAGHRTRRPRRQAMSSRTTQAQAEATARRQAAETMAEAAQAWLASLDAGQRTAACGPAPAGDGSDTERHRWFYTPTDHGGLTVNQQRPAQQRAAMRLVASGLSTARHAPVPPALRPAH